MSSIRIDVVGKSLSGKSTIMLMIADMLEKHGVSDIKIVPHIQTLETMKNLDEDNDMKEEILNNLSVIIKEVPEITKF